ncbi:hypothetical protein [Marivirga lumbricoides]
MKNKIGSSQVLFIPDLKIFAENLHNNFQNSDYSSGLVEYDPTVLENLLNSKIDILDRNDLVYNYIFDLLQNKNFIAISEFLKDAIKCRKHLHNSILKSITVILNGVNKENISSLLSSIEVELE